MTTNGFTNTINRATNNVNNSINKTANRIKWTELAMYYVQLAMKEITNPTLSDEYKEKADKCRQNINLDFDANLYPDLIPQNWQSNAVGSIPNIFGGLPNYGNSTMNPYIPPVSTGYTGTNTQGTEDEPYKHFTNNPTPNITFNPNENTQNNNQMENPYRFDFDTTTEEKKLEKYILSDLPVLIHGLSGCGKSARIKEMDPDCTIIYLATAKPETLTGKQINVNGELKDVPPPWYTKMCKKCEDEPDKIHILFLDECTNATPTIQGYAFNLVLDKELDGQWKLPKNARIVAAGNEINESLSANKIPEPLFRRFNHIYIKTTLKGWLLWASKHNIHPAIYAFVASRGEGEYQVLRTECDGVNPCVDPRKWEMASDFLKKNGKANMLSGIIGEKLTNEFIKFCQKKVITLEDVLTDNYDVNMSRMKADVALSTLVGLVSVDEKEVKKVRDFVKKYIIPEQYQNFVRMWTLGDEKRIEMLQEFDLMDEQVKTDDINVETVFKERGK